MSGSEERVTRLFVLLGYEAEWDKPEKLYHRLRVITEEEYQAGTFEAPSGEKDNVWRFDDDRTMRRVFGGYSPGALFRIDTRGTSIVVSTATFVGLWPKMEDRVRWAAVSRAIRQRADGVKQAKRVDDFKDALEPIRLAYRATNAPNRAQLIAAVVAYISG